MNKGLYTTYARLEAEKDDIEAEQKGIKEQIMVELQMLPEGKNGVEIAQGAFTLQKKPIYGFSKVIDDMEANLKTHKAQEIAMGVAKIKSTTEYVVYRPVKIVT